MKAFSLIELLVVIAIIGILSAVVLASLNAARNRQVETPCSAYKDYAAKDLPARCISAY